MSQAGQEIPDLPTGAKQDLSPEQLQNVAAAAVIVSGGSVETDEFGGNDAEMSALELSALFDCVSDDNKKEAADAVLEGGKTSGETLKDYKNKSDDGEPV